MKTFSIVLYLIFLHPEAWTDVAKSVPKTVNATAFDLTVKGKKLAGSLLKTEVSTSLGKCALACNKNNLCRSFSFCGSATCHLNREDTFSTNKTESCLIIGENCKYFGMTKISTPVCEEDGVYSDIKDDLSSGCCQINGKRVDKEWAPWKEASILDDG